MTPAQYRQQTEVNKIHHDSEVIGHHVFHLSEQNRQL